MTLWFVFALMTAAAIFAVLWPLGRRGRPQNSDGSETTVYKDQLAEVDRDLAAGLIGSSEAEAARVEISRRLLAAADNRRDPSAASNLSLRRSAGDPGPGGIGRSYRSRFTSRWFAASARFSPARHPRARRQPVARQSGRSGRGASGEKSNRWPRLERVRAGAVRLGRYDEAARAFRNSIIYGGDSSDRRADLGEARDGAAGGVVTSEAKTEFERASL